MRKTQHCLEYSYQRSTCPTLLRLVTFGELILGHLEVPVTVLVPHEAVDRTRDVVEPIFGEATVDLCLGALERADNPPVPHGQFDRSLLVRSAVLALSVHQHKAARVPQLVAEIAIALAARQVEVERPSVGGERREGEAHRVRAEGRDAARVVHPYVFLDLGSMLATQQADGGLFEQGLKRNAVD